MENCIFCKIIAGEIPSRKILETEKVFAFMDITPISDGHCLVIPKQHFTDIHDLEVAGIGDELLSSCQEVAKLLKEKLGHKGIMIMELNGEPQEVPHIHFHVFGRDSNSPSKLVRPENTNTNPEYINSIHQKLTS